MSALEGSLACEIYAAIPVFNDWEPVGLLLPILDEALNRAGRRAKVLLIDDGSTTKVEPKNLARAPFAAIGQIEILSLRRNLGHQRAIAIALAFLEDQRPNCVMAVIMDGDGEDDPRDVPRLLDRCEREGQRAIVFAERTRRSESRAFRVGYWLYRRLHRILVGPAMRIGNFSVAPRQRLQSLAAVSELWSHYAAAAVKSRQPIVLEPTARAKRLSGQSRMNFVQLVVHGLSAIAVYSETVGARLLAASLGLAGLVALGLGLVLSAGLVAGWSFPGWTLVLLTALAILLALAIMFSFLFSFIILGGRSAPGFLPRRDYPHFIDQIHVVFPFPARDPDLNLNLNLNSTDPDPT